MTKFTPKNAALNAEIRQALRLLLPSGFLLIAGTPDGKEVEMDAFIPANPITKQEVNTDTAALIRTMSAEMLSTGLWTQHGRVKVEDLAREDN